jgi:hypothetical protein
MSDRMWFLLTVVGTSLGLFAGVLVLFYAGRRLADRRDVDGERGVSVVDAGAFGLLSLLVAFTFTGAATRFDVRRQLIIDESNAIGTAYLRLSMLPEPQRHAVQAELRRYVDSRIETYRRLPDRDAALAERARSLDLQQQIWDDAVTASEAEGAPVTAPTVLLPALNQMFDLAVTRTAMTEMHPPMIIFGMLFALALVAALLAGHGLSPRSRLSALHVVGFAAAMSVVVFVIFDLEFPRLGVFRIDDFDHLLVDARASMR